MSVQSTGLSPEERSSGARPTRQTAGEAFRQFDCVRTIKETAAILGIGEPSLRVMIREGRGPQVTRLSPRRIGIRDSHREFWLASRLEAASV
jgi:predicted DNA-binding transcriptional regulator AlpA